MTPDPILDSRLAWTTAIAAFVVMVISSGAPGVAVVAMRQIAADLDTTRSGAAAAGSLVFIGSAVGGIGAGWLAGRYGIRRVVMFGVSMIAAGLVLSATGGLLEFYAGHGLLIGLFGYACMFSPLLTYVSQWFEKRRGSAIALIASGQSVGGALWPLLFVVGVDSIGWRNTMLAFAAVVLVSGIALAVLFLHPPPASAPPPPRVARDAGKHSATLGLPPNVLMALLMLASFACCLPMAMPMQHVVAYCGDLAFDPRVGAAMLSVLAGTAFVARQLWGWLSDRLGGLQTLLWGSVIQGTALAGFVLTREPWTMFVVSALFGLGLAALMPAYVLVIRDCYPLREVAWRLPTVILAAGSGMAAGGWGAGVVYDHTADYRPAFLLGIAFNLLNLAVLLFLFSRPRRPMSGLGVSASASTAAAPSGGATP